MSEPCSTPGCNVNPPQLKFYQAFTFATPIIFTLVLLLLFCVLYVRRRQTARAVSQLRAQFFARGIFSAWPIDHGLTKSFRATLPTIVFDEHIAASREDNQCAVCLSDYQFGDKLQQLPLCDHLFHVECIDEWLASNATCPICRTSLLQVGKMVPLDSLNTGAASSQESHGESSNRNAISSSSSSGGGGGGGSGVALAANVLPPTSSNNNISSNINSNNNGEASKAEVGSEGPSHRSVSSMEDVVKDSTEHIIHIER